MRQIYDYIIIGSGFGGSVSAMRLTEKGYSVLVLEKGKRFEDKDFAKSNWQFWKYLWLPALRAHGILQVSILKGVMVLHGAGVGGGAWAMPTCSKSQAMKRLRRPPGIKISSGAKCFSPITRWRRECSVRHGIPGSGKPIRSSGKWQMRYAWDTPSAQRMWGPISARRASQ